MSELSEKLRKFAQQLKAMAIAPKEPKTPPAVPPLKEKNQSLKGLPNPVGTRTGRIS